MNDSSSHEKKRCGGKTNSGGICKRWPAKGGNGRCKRHNGNAVKGPAHPSWKHGEYSKWLPKHMQQTFEETGNDPELLSNRNQIRLTDTFIIDNIKNLKTGENEEVWNEFLKILTEMKAAYLESDSPGMAIGFQLVFDLIDDRIAHYQTQREIMTKVEQRRKLIETEQKLELQGNRAVSVEQLFWLMGAVLSIIETVVTSQEERIEIGTRVDKLITASS